MTDDTAPKIDPARVALGVRLAAAREKKLLTQEQVAKLFDVIKGTVSAWEKGRGVPDALRLHRLARLYGVTPNDLLGEQSAVDWPFGDAVTPAQYLALPLEIRQMAIDGLRAAVQRQEAAQSATPVTSAVLAMPMPKGKSSDFQPPVSSHFQKNKAT